MQVWLALGLTSMATAVLVWFLEETSIKAKAKYDKLQKHHHHRNGALCSSVRLPPPHSCIAAGRR